MDMPEGSKATVVPMVPIASIPMVPTTPISIGPSNLLTFVPFSIKILPLCLFLVSFFFFFFLISLLETHIYLKFLSGPLPTKADSSTKFEVRSIFAIIPNPMSEAAAFFARVD